MRHRVPVAASLVVAAGIAVSAVSCGGSGAVDESDGMTYPDSHPEEVADDYFGTRVPDPYRWMEDLNAPAIAAWVAAQNALTFAYLDALPEREAFTRRITELWNYPRVGLPFFEGGRWFYYRNAGLERQSVVYMRSSPDEPATVVLDPNALSPDGSVALSDFVPSPDGRRFTYGQAAGGSDWSTYYFRDTLTGAWLPDGLQWVKFSTVSWTHDGQGVFYGRYPQPPPGRELEAALTDKRIYYHRLGTDQSADRLVYARPDDPTLFIDAHLDETGRYLFIDTNKGTSNRNELFVKDLVNPMAPQLDAPVTPLYPGHTAAYVPLGVSGSLLYLMTDRDAPTRKIVSVAIARPDPANWRTIVPEDVNPIESASLVAGLLAVNRLEDVASAVRFYQLDGAEVASLETPGLGAITGPVGRFDRPEIFYSFTSPLYPSTVFQYEAGTAMSTPFEPPVLAFDPSDYETERVFATSKDGTRVPVFVTHKRGLVKDGSNPTMLYGYGGFNIPTQPTYRSDLPAWLERGGVWATAGLRGGSEYGEAWHQAAMFEKKQNVFDDFIAAAEYLVREGYASPETLGIMGGSNGGLLVGAVMEQRPDLFAVALPGAGVMDMLRYHKFTGGSAWATEYGSADDPSAFVYLAAYSPVHNVVPGTCYPATLVTTADHDDRVVPSHSFKFAAALQAGQGCERPVFIRVETQASHGYRPTDKRIQELADEWAFALANFGKPK